MDSPYEKRTQPGLLELLRSRPHIQLNTEVDQGDFEGAPAADGYVRVQHVQRKFAQTESVAD